MIEIYVDKRSKLKGLVSSNGSIIIQPIYKRLVIKQLSTGDFKLYVDGNKKVLVSVDEKVDSNLYDKLYIDDNKCLIAIKEGVCYVIK